jgi:tetratricopeptide (TPR) repeat protein
MSLATVLAQLEQSQLIRRLDEDDSAYTFKHILAQEAVYSSLLVKRRRELHRRVAEHYERLYGDALDTVAELLAYHYAEAGDDAKTLRYATLAGDVAAQWYANVEAVAHYSQALAVARRTEASGEQLLHLYTRRGRVFEVSSQVAQALANYEDMEQVAQERGDRNLELAALLARATVYSTGLQYDRDKALALCERALALARELDDRAAESKCYWILMIVRRFGDPDVRQTLAYGEQALAIARELDLREQLAFIANDLAGFYGVTGQRARGRALAEEARDLWRELGNLPMLSDNLAGYGYEALFNGDYGQAMALFDEAFRLSQSIGHLWGMAHSQMKQGWLYLEMGQPGKAIAIMEQAIHLAQEAGHPGWRQPCADLSWTYAILGDLDRAFTYAHEALANLGTTPPPGILTWPLAVLAQLHLLNGDLDAADRAIQESAYDVTSPGLAAVGSLPAALVDGAIALAEGNGERAIAAVDALIARLRQLNGRLYLADGLYLRSQALRFLERTDAAYEALVEARTEAEERGARRILWEILFALSQLELERGNAAEAKNLRDQAREIVNYIANHTGTPELRASFLSLPQVQAVFGHEGLNRTHGMGRNGEAP